MCPRLSFCKAVVLNYNGNSLYFGQLMVFLLRQFFVVYIAITFALLCTSRNSLTDAWSPSPSPECLTDCHVRERVFKRCDIIFIDITEELNQTVAMEFVAYGRNFNIILWEDSSIFDSSVRVSVKSRLNTSTQDLTRQTHLFVGGSLNDKSVWCQGTIFNSVFDGVIHAGGEVYYVEPVVRYCPDSLKIRNKNIVYRKADVYSHLADFSQPKYVKYQHQHSNPRRADEVDFVHPVHRQTEPGHLSRLRRNVDNPISCPLKLVADHLFFQHVGEYSVTRTLSEIAILVREADSIFRSTDINGDGTSDNLGFVIYDITIYTDKTLPGYKLGDFLVDYVEYLEAFAEYDFSEFCMALAFTYRDFAKGIVGLAWVASSSIYSYPGGICQERIYLPSKGKDYSFNTAMVTFINHGNRIPRSETISTLTHELGHSFGSPHDMESNKVCAPGGYLGNFIMYPYASDATKPNHYKFSSCSVASINPVLVNKGHCLVNHPGAVCGNGLVEAGEECDCGTISSCPLVDQCCTPSDVSPLSVDRPCTIKRQHGYFCSPKVSLCCNESCQVLPAVEKFVCRQETECSYKSTCDGSSANCPTADPKPNGTTCSDLNLYCYLGTCQTSLCKIYGLVDCLCSQENELCSVCCEGVTVGCQPIDTHLSDVSRVNSSSLNYSSHPKVIPGQPCKNYHGYCNEKAQCVMIGSDSTFERFANMFGPDTAQGVKEWLSSNWFYLVLGVITILVLVMLFWVNGKCYHNTTVVAKRTAKLLQLLSEAQSQKQLITKKLERYKTLVEEKESGAYSKNKLDRVLAVSRLLMLFPTLTGEEVSRIAEQVTGEEIAVRYLLLRGHPLVKILRYPNESV